MINSKVANDVDILLCLKGHLIKYIENTSGNLIHQGVTHSLLAEVGNMLFIDSIGPFL